MIGLILLIAFWLAVGLAVFVIALGGGPAGARARFLQSQSRRGRRATVTVILIVCLAFGVVLPAIVIASGEHQSKTGIAADIKLNAAQKQGRVLFGHTCNQCHTLSASHTVGRVGPNLDNLRPPEALVLNAVQQGRARGRGRMPAALLQGRDAQDVAAYVSKVAGRQ